MAVFININENVYTQTFTPREYQVELLESAKKRNTIVCSSTSSAKAFILIKLLQEFSHEISSRKRKALFILDSQNVTVMKSHISYLTDLKAMDITESNIYQSNTIFQDNQVLLTTAEICIKSDILINLPEFGLLVIDDCLYGDRQVLARKIIEKYETLPKNKQPRILGLTTGLLGSELQPDRLEAELLRLEKLLNSTVDTSSEIVSLIRLSCHPKESLIMCSKENPFNLKDELVNIIESCKTFLLDHRFDPSETYPEEFLDEYKDIANPSEIPLELCDTYLDILEDLGPFGADKAAQNLLSRIEKLKMKTKYERHYLLLCVVSTTLIKCRAACDYEFEKFSTEMEKVQAYSTSKVLKCIEVLRQFKLPGQKPKPADDTEKPPEENVPKRAKGKPRRYQRMPTDDTLCALVFVHNRYKAKALFGILCTISQNDDDFWWVSARFSVDKLADVIKEPIEAENEHKAQEEVLRKFRCHDCNILVSTSVLESGCDLPKCNLVIRFDLPETFHSYIQSKAKARAPEAHYILFLNENEVDSFVDRLAEYNEVENTLLRRCSSLEPSKDEELLADKYSKCCQIYQPLNEQGAPSVSLFSAIALINKYCVKLPSDTFTRLTPIWHEEQVANGFVCHIRLPINSPVKRTISSPVMPNALLSRRAAAFLLCQYLHKMGELDDQLQPINKENFVPLEDEWCCNFELDEDFDENSEVRPGTTKRRQYYYKKIANYITDCLPTQDKPTYFYEIHMTLTCPLPDEQNTRGRKLYPPEESPQGFGILTSREIPKISAFPIFTRSGEVSVELVLHATNVDVTQERLRKIEEFVNYTFTSVLRLQKYLMLFDPNLSSMNYLIVPTITRKDSVEVDWEFIDIIYENLSFVPTVIPEETRKKFIFNPDVYSDAVVMPWYRNKDQPQYFYVAKIYKDLNPTSDFTNSSYKSFEEYFLKKYNIQIQNLDQYLLDVDHTSARLNFLTPRYVNRKGVALPTSSEETKRAKRENLEQKQFLVPELCAIHPFPASLWRKAVALPCILYRINALLLADQIREQVAQDLQLGRPKLDKDFKWLPLNFGWNLSDVLRKSREEEQRKQEEMLKKAELKLNQIIPEKVEEIEDDDENEDEQSDDIDDELVVDTWNNDMAPTSADDGSLVPRYVSPTNWSYEYDDDFSDDDDLSDSYVESVDSDNEYGRLKIEYREGNMAEAVEEDEDENEIPEMVDDMNAWTIQDDSHQTSELRQKFHDACKRNKEHILSNGMLIRPDQQFQKKSDSSPTLAETTTQDPLDFDFERLIVKKIPEPPVSVTSLVPRDKAYDHPDELTFSFDKQPDLTNHPGPSPNVLLQALTMSNANDGINLERLETIGDSFLKYAITSYLYTKYENVHEGKLSHLRSKQVSNLNLYKLGKKKNLGEYMIATKFDPHDNWLPPCFYVPKKLEDALIDAQYPANCWTVADMAATRKMDIDEICTMVKERKDCALTNIIPYNLVTQHSIPDKSIADCVEALIGAYLIECGPRGALLFMAWLGIKVLPYDKINGTYGELAIPKSPLLHNIPNASEELARLLDGYDAFERHIGYKFKDRAYLLQAFTHASYSPNQLTDCYQRLEFLGDAVLDYLITRHLYEDPRMHSPGALTDLRSALVNNTIFAALAVRNGFHKYFKHLSPGLNDVVERFIRLQEESGHNLVNELYFMMESECEEVEDVEVPKALGDVFESVAGAIFLDSNMSLDAVWKVYHRMMKQEIEQFSNKVPKSPIRELLELEPETAKFLQTEKLADGRRVRVTVQIFGIGKFIQFKGIGRNYRIAKSTAAKCALKYLKKRGKEGGKR